MKTLYTLGYAGHSIQTFLDVIQHHSIECILDVRRRPQSRKPGFSKTSLHRALADAGIGYHHIVDLGTPNDLRDELRDTGDYHHFFGCMRIYLKTQESVLSKVLVYAMEQRCALLCLEADPLVCHRSVVAEVLAEHTSCPLTIEHIGHHRRTRGIIESNNNPFAGVETHRTEEQLEVFLH